jgi:hypothetical protein
MTLLVVFMVAAILAGCSMQRAQPQEPDLEGGPHTVVLQAAPQEIQEWVANSLRLFAGQARDHGDRTYLLLTLGEKPTGGYEARISSLSVSGGDLVALCRFKEPSPGETVSQAKTYPFDLVTVPRLEVPVEFRAEGDTPPHIMRVLGSDVEPIVAESTWIKVFEPRPGQVVAGSFSLRGLCSAFEGTVNYRLMRNSSILHEGFATGAMGDWGYFEAVVPLDTAENGPAVLEVFTYSAKDGSVQDLISIDVTVE